MKRYITHHRSSLLLGLLLLTACDQYLEENPDNRVDLNTTEKAAQLLTNAYSAGGYQFTEWMTDNVTYTSGTTKLPEHVQAYEWEDIFPVNQDTPTNFWENTYDAIAHANEVLAVIDNLPGEEAQRDAVKGEALLARAYGHFMLVNLFAKHYDASTATSDPGIPYPTEPERDFLVQYERLSVQEVYDQIEDDMLDGLRLVDATFYANSGKYHFTREAALALASRFYLFKGEWEKCISYSTQMLGDDPSVFVKDIYGMLAQSSNDDDFIRKYTAPTERSNLLMIRQVTNFPVNVGFWPDFNIFSYLFYINPFNSDDDARISTEGYPVYQRGDNGICVNKYEFLFERNSITSNVGLNYTIATAFHGEEVLLNRAEAYVQLNQLNLALADLQILARKRYTPTATLTTNLLRQYYNNSNNQQNALVYVLEERQKEFIHEGLRWFDIKRYGYMIRHLLQDGSIIILEADDKRKVLQIPQAAIDVGGLTPNER
ncbi:RagB/SusD family nutrient uptake outer membrane protein [Dawidia soli]|uniref:RagB/SusD family nutrient uptake outer membrane protein n=1 Tax=Dawidia soli TaxID=2782352 RepID=A0AAP2DCV1_9BACT|nr:RagB/SusD family nutrient uptake outer membrane protein [Dawidia soli]MBT1688410.1 RagB/SusD family nutrient uptake outer membrane protein [Dawidia soli]